MPFKSNKFLSRILTQKITEKIDVVEGIVLCTSDDCSFNIASVKFNDGFKSGFVSLYVEDINEFSDCFIKNYKSTYIEAIRMGSYITPTIASIINKIESILMFECDGYLPEIQGEHDLDLPLKLLLENCCNDYKKAFFKLDDICLTNFINLCNNGEATHASLLLK